MKKKRILIADDELSIIKFLRAILKDKGYPKVFAVLLQFIIALTLLFLIPFEETTYLFNPTNEINISNTEPSSGPI